MTNPYYNPTGNPATGSQGLSALMRTEFANISTAFGLLPTLAGNGGLVVAVNLGGTALTVVPGSTISTTGAFTTIFAQAANVTLTLPGVNGTLALLASPAFTGTPTAPTASGGTNTTQLATTAFVTAAVGAGGVVSSVAGRTGAVVLTNADISGSAPLASPTLTGTPTAPTASGGTNTTQLATTAFVTAAVGSGGVVSSVAGRTGAVVLAVADVSGAAPLASPALTGNPTAPTATVGDNDTSIATTAFVQTMPGAPPPIGNTTPNTGAFTTLAASSTVSGAGFTARFATPGPIGNTTASTGAFTTLSASSTVSGAGFTAWAASPPSIGSTSPGTGAFTTLSATGLISPASGVGVKGSLVAVQAGSVGETIQQSAGASFAEATPSNLMQITLPTAGIWLVFANTLMSPFSGATTMVQCIFTISKTSATLSALGGYTGFNQPAGGVGEFDAATGPVVVTTTTSTIIYAVGYIATLAGTGGKHASGFLTAVRIA